VGSNATTLRLVDDSTPSPLRQVVGEGRPGSSAGTLDPVQVSSAVRSPVLAYALASHTYGMRPVNMPNPPRNCVT
jgi:hypothetical protein